MVQGKFKKKLDKLIKKGDRGYPIATIAYYGPSNTLATKLVCGIIKVEGGDADQLKKWYSKVDLKKSENILEELLQFITENNVRSVVMVDRIMGCPHEEGIDYPEGEYCPLCAYWKGRDRFTHKMLH